VHAAKTGTGRTDATGDGVGREMPSATLCGWLRSALHQINSQMAPRFARCPGSRRSSPSWTVERVNGSGRPGAFDMVAGVMPTCDGAQLTRAAGIPGRCSPRLGASGQRPPAPLAAPLLRTGRASIQRCEGSGTPARHGSRGGEGWNPAPREPLAGGHAGTGCGSLRRRWRARTPRRAARAAQNTGNPTLAATARKASAEVARVRHELGETGCRHP
jgi:hypothetical protein